MREPQLEILNVSKSFGRKTVLHDVSFRLSQGSLTAIVGENGSGKSTLLKIIAGELRPDRGRIGKTGTIGYCPQESVLFPMLTVQENIEYFGSAYGVSSKFVGNVLALRLGLAAHAACRVDKLSGGTRQKLNLMISLLADPEICILDEPYGGFDWESYQLFWSVMNELRERGRVILLITHLVTDLEMFDRVYTLRNGSL